LYELSTARAAGSPRVMYTMAMLCYRVAKYTMREFGGEGGQDSNAGNLEVSDGEDSDEEIDSSTNKKSHNRNSSSDSKSTSIQSHARRCELLTRCAKLLKFASDMKGPNRYLLRANIHEELATALYAWAEFKSQQTPVGSAPSLSEREEIMGRLSTAMFHWQQVVFCVLKEHEEQSLRPPASPPASPPQRGSARSPSSPSSPDESPAKHMFLDTKNSVRRGVLACCFSLAKQYQAMGLLGHAIRVLHEGLLGECKFPGIKSNNNMDEERGEEYNAWVKKTQDFFVSYRDKWPLDWPLGHTKAEVACGLELYGDILLEQSRHVLKKDEGSNTDKLNTVSFELIHFAENDLKIFWENKATNDIVKEFNGCLRASDEENKSKIESKYLLAEALGILASKCYLSCTSVTKNAYWKLGNALNEIGKLRMCIGIANGDCFRFSSQAFKAAGDTANEMLVQINLATLLRRRGLSGLRKAVDILTQANEAATSTTKHFDNWQEVHTRSSNQKDGGLRNAGRHENKIWRIRVRTELAMSHLHLGYELRLACQAVTAASAIKQIHYECTKHLNTALLMYQSMGKMASQDIGSKGTKTAACHFHLGSQYAWLSFTPASTLEEVLREGKTESSFAIISRLAKHHLTKAQSLFPLGSMERLQCRLSLAKLNDSTFSGQVHALGSIVLNITEENFPDASWPKIKDSLATHLVSALKSSPKGEHASSLKDLYRHIITNKSQSLKEHHEVLVKIHKLTKTILTQNH